MDLYTYRVTVSHNSAKYGNVRAGEWFSTDRPVDSIFVTLVSVEVVEEPRVEDPAESGERKARRTKSRRSTRPEGGERDEARGEADGPEESGAPVGQPEAQAGPDTV